MLIDSQRPKVFQIPFTIVNIEKVPTPGKVKKV